MENPNFLKQKYNLHNAPETEAAAKRTEKRTGEKVPQNPQDRIQNYLNRFNEILERDKPKEKEQGIEALKKILHTKFIIKPEKIPESYFNSIKRKHREEGHGDIEIPDDYRQELAQAIIGDQKRSLDRWINYLCSDEDKHDDWLKYYTFCSILKMGRYDKKKKSFTERYGGAISPFPELNREALAIVLGDIEKRENKELKFEFTKRYDIKPEIKQKYLQFLENKNFAGLYALAIEEFKPIAEELLKIIDGKWVKYPKGSNHIPLAKSIEEYGTGWCLRGEDMAQRYLVRDKNDLYVYYSLDKKGEPVVPRAVMVVNASNKITEVRGVAEGENLDPYIGEVVEGKLNEPEFKEEGKAYKKKSADMKFLTMIDEKTKAKEPLIKEDLIFLYEIESPIEGFGYDDEKDPRIAEIRATRNPEEDAAIIFECSKEQIARRQEEINENTKAYIGGLKPRIFELTQKFNIEHIYTKFPEDRIEQFTVELGGQTEEEIISELERRKRLADDDKEKIYMDSAKSILKNDEFYTLKNKERIKFIKLKVRDLGFPYGATTQEIYEKAEKLGLDLCPPETGPQIRLHYEEIFKREQPKDEWFYIGMKTISDSDGNPDMF